jgi:hypothetical protein
MGMTSRLLRRAAATTALALAVVSGGVAAAAPAAAATTYTIVVPSKVWIGQWIDVGIDCPTTCPVGVTDATMTISDGPALELPAEPDYIAEWQVTGITGGFDSAPVTHTFTATFVDETGASRTLSKTVQVNIDGPDYVENLAPVDGSPSSVTWDPPLVDGGAPVTRYLVEVDGDGDWVTLPATARSFSLAGFPYGPHTVRVVAANAHYSGWGDPVTVIQGVMPPAPAVTVTGTTAPKVSWTQGSGVGIGITGFAVYSDGVEVARTAASARTVTLSALDPGPQGITVAALTAWGPSAESAPAAWVQPSAPSPVEPPAVARGTESLTVTWSPPSSDGGLPVASYAVKAWDPVTGTVLATATTAAATRSATLTGLTSGMPYRVSVAARNAMGSSWWADSVDAVAPLGTASASTLSARPSASSPTAAQRIYVSGVLTIPGRSETGQKVHVFVKPYGASAWALAGTASASSTGAWRLARTFPVSTQVQARYFGSAALNTRAAASSVTTVAPSVAVSIRTATASGATRTSFTRGATVMVPVATVGAASGASASLQRKSGSRWVTVRTVALSGGKARIAWKPSARGSYSVRVLVGAGAGIKAGLSRVVTVRIT